MDALNRRRNDVAAATVLVLFAVIYYCLIYRYSINLADEGSVALISQRLMHGEHPFQDVQPGYNVLWFYPISALFRAFGTNLLLMRAYFYAISACSGLIAFLTLRRLDAPLWLALIQGLIVISINGQYFKAYIPFLVIANLFAITLFLTSQRKRLPGFGVGMLLGTTFLIRIDIAIFCSVVWLFVFLFHTILLSRRLILNVATACYCLLGFVAVHLPFLYDAYHRRFLEPFVHQYSDIAALILRPIIPHVPETPGVNQRQALQKAAPSDGTGAMPMTATNSSVLQRRHFHEIFLKSPSIEKRLLAFLTYIPALLICALGVTGLYLCILKTITLDRWLLFSALLAVSLSVFPQFFFFRPDLPHLIEFMKGGAVALTCAGWILWATLGKSRISVLFALAIGVSELAYVWLAFASPYGGTLLVRLNRHMEFRGANGVDVLLNRVEHQEVAEIYSATVLNSAKNDYVACYPYLPGVNFITGRPTFQSNLYVDNLTQSVEWQQSEISKIQRYRPAVIIIDDWKINGTDDSRFTHWAKEVTRYIQSHYRLVSTAGGKLIFARLTPS
jgi:hypothetical protein